MAEGSKRKIIEGIVISDKMQKSVVVKVNYLFAHPRYKKIMKKTKKYMAHDESQQCSIGDKVRIREVRPLSKRKNWIVTEILEKGN